MAGTLFIVATPIGNLEDITFRAVRVLKGVAVIASEDTRVTRKLLERYGITKPLLPFFEHSRRRATERILSSLSFGEDVAYVTCAGTPAVSDPGPKLIQAVLEEFGNDARIIPIPGPSAVTTIASLSSVPMNEFHFFGYPPAKKGRGGYFRRVAENLYPSILFESPHRLMKTLNDLEKALGVERRVIIGRELTKIFETVYRGSLGGIRAMLGEETPRGEYVILIEPAHRSRSWNQEGKEKVHNGRP